MGNAIGVLKVAAKRVGVSVAEYEARVASGERWCSGCKAWHHSGKFSTDRSRGGSLARTCRTWRNLNLDRAPEPVEKRRARRLVQMRVRRGTLPHPGTLPCADCGRMATKSGKRHEYHHHKGYSGEHAADVIALCSTCHSRKEN